MIDSKDIVVAFVIFDLMHRINCLLIPVHLKFSCFHVFFPCLVQWSCNGPLIELLMSNVLITSVLVENTAKIIAEGDMLVNYNNIHKVFYQSFKDTLSNTIFYDILYWLALHLQVLWEPFLEPWSFQINMIRDHDKNALLHNGIITDIELVSTTQLNINITKSLCEVCAHYIFHVVCNYNYGYFVVLDFL